MSRSTSKRMVIAASVVTLAATAMASPIVSATAGRSSGDAGRSSGGRSDRPVTVEVFAPEHGDRAGIEGAGWFVDLALEFPGHLKSTGFTGNQLTGPPPHADAPPFPGSFSPGRDDRTPGLVVLVSGTASTAPLSGPGTNLANLFNLTGVTDRSKAGTELWDTWIVGAPLFGTGRTVLRVAVVDDLDGNGVYDDAPDVVADADGSGRITNADLEAIGLASDIERVVFRIDGRPA